MRKFQILLSALVLVASMATATDFEATQQAFKDRMDEIEANPKGWSATEEAAAVQRSDVRVRHVRASGVRHLSGAADG